MEFKSRAALFDGEELIGIRMRFGADFLTVKSTRRRASFEFVCCSMLVELGFIHRQLENLRSTSTFRMQQHLACRSSGGLSYQVMRMTGRLCSLMASIALANEMRLDCF